MPNFILSDSTKFHALTLRLMWQEFFASDSDSDKKRSQKSEWKLKKREICVRKIYLGWWNVTFHLLFNYFYDACKLTRTIIMFSLILRRCVCPINSEGSGWQDRRRERKQIKDLFCYEASWQRDAHRDLFSGRGRKRGDGGMSPRLFSC